jgi:hypothetical protein
VGLFGSELFQLETLATDNFQHYKIANYKITISNPRPTAPHPSRDAPMAFPAGI